MDNWHYIIEGGHKLHGEINVHGSKNSILPILISSALCEGVSEIYHCPKLSDVDNVVKILGNLGCKVDCEDDKISVDPLDIHETSEPDFLMRELRASILFLSVLLAKFRKAVIPSPGGCSIGLRPIDLHITGLTKMGVTFKHECGILHAECEDGLKGARINLGFPSVGATENIIMAAVLAQGETVINNAAREPEIIDLANFLIKCGAKIKCAGESTVYIEGVTSLQPCKYKIIPDRIVASTYMGCVAAAGGDLCLRNINREHMGIILPMYEAAGCQVNVYSNDLIIKKTKRLSSLKIIKTEPFPGFPTDAQAILMSDMVLSYGNTVFIETVFENRFHHAPELRKMGAEIITENNIAVVCGVKQLHGAEVDAQDLRGGVALMAAALAAEGKTILNGVEYIERGYDNIEKQLTSVGAKILKTKK